jgi:hypothetical protein
MFTTVSIEFVGDTEQHLKALEHELKHIHKVHVDLVEPRDHAAPVLVAIGIKEDREKAVGVTQSIAQTLYNFLHDDASVSSNKKLYLVTAEGDRVDIEPLQASEINTIIAKAYENEPE